MRVFCIIERWELGGKLDFQVICKDLFWMKFFQYLFNAKVALIAVCKNGLLVELVIEETIPFERLSITVA